MPAWESDFLFSFQITAGRLHCAGWLMDLLDVFRKCLAWMATVAALWPFNIPLAALAYKIRQGHKPIDMESDEYWWRCTLGSLVLAGSTLAMIWLDYFLTSDLELPPGPVHMVVFVGYVSLASWLFYLFFALEDFFQALAMVAIYMFVPIVVLLPLNFLTHWWDYLLNLPLSWLK